jgi:hypothetical protein
MPTRNHEANVRHIERADGKAWCGAAMRKAHMRPHRKECAGCNRKIRIVRGGK